MKFKVSMLCLIGVMVGSSCPASAVIIDLAPSDYLFGPSYSQDGYTFTNSNVANGSYANWVAGGFPAFNASNANGDIVQVGAATTNTITNDASQAFSFSSIGLADVYNNGSGGDVLFTFNHVGGGTNSATVSLLHGVFGLQTFLFNETDLTSVVFTPLTTEGPYLQFDSIGVNVSAVPEPSTWAMMLLGFAGLAYTAHRRRGSANLGKPVALALAVALAFSFASDGHAQAKKKEKPVPTDTAPQGISQTLRDQAKSQSSTVGGRNGCTAWHQQTGAPC